MFIIKNPLGGEGKARWPSSSQWKQLPRVLTPKERLLLAALLVLFFGSSFVLAKGLYISQTHIVPAHGGHVTEGIVGSPRFLNPIYADANDVDRDLIQLIYSGLLAYGADGSFQPDLAQELQMEDEGKTFTFTLKENVRWSDGAPFGADDVIFTIKTIQDPQYKSPVRANWVGVEVEKISDLKLRIHLLEPYAPFLERLTLKIIPAHIWNSVTPENFPLSPYNFQPIGTGPYVVTKTLQEKSGAIKEIHLEANSKYHSNPPFLESFTVKFFQNEEELVREAKRGGIQSFSVNSREHIAALRNTNFVPHSFSFPRYFAVFFNLAAPSGQEIVEEKRIREALKAATDKEAIGKTFFGDASAVVHSPLLPNLFGLQEPQEPQQNDPQAALSLFEKEGFAQQDGKLVKTIPPATGLRSDLNKGDTGAQVRRLQECLAQDREVYPDGVVNGVFGPLTESAVIAFQEKYADEVLAPIGLNKGTGKAGPLTREKLNALCFSEGGEALALTITLTTVDQSPLKEVAELIKEQWEALGVEVEIRTFPPTILEREIIKPREYQALLFGEVLGVIPDPFPFWHSSQKKDPGLNLSSYGNKAADALLEKARKEPDQLARLQMYEELQEIILQDSPAIFLYDLDYTYFVSDDIKGIQPQLIADPSQRFSAVSEWYIKTKRAKK